VRSDLFLVVAVLAACIWVARGSRWAAAIECSLPLIAIAALAIHDERARFFAIGLIVAAAFAGAALVASDRIELLIAGVALLRWLPLRDVEVWREVVVLMGLVALFVAMGRDRLKPVATEGTWQMPTVGTGFSLSLVAVLAVAAVTPIHPGKAALLTLVLAGLVLAPPAARAAAGLACLALAPFVRWSFVPLLVAAAFVLLVPFLAKLRPLAYAAALALFAVWPWSGAAARALPAVVRFDPPVGEVRPVGWSLGRGESLALEIPRSRHVIVNASAANGLSLPPGTLLGFIEAGGCAREVRTGDVADFGFTRREHFFFARHSLPRITRADIRGLGATSWLHGAGAVGVACGGRELDLLRFRGAHETAKLQIESVELPAR
jgi:hypothetical protein